MIYSMSTSLLKSFIIGSSVFIYLPFLYRVSNIPNNIKNYSYITYSFIAPIFFGSMSTIATILQHNFSISLFYSLLIVMIISILFVLSSVTTLNLYNFTTNQQWLLYSSRLIIFYSIAYSTIYFITKLLD